MTHVILLNMSTPNAHPFRSNLSDQLLISKARLFLEHGQMLSSVKGANVCSRAECRDVSSWKISRRMSTFVHPCA